MPNLYCCNVLSDLLQYLFISHSTARVSGIVRVCMCVHALLVILLCMSLAVLE